MVLNVKIYKIKLVWLLMLKEFVLKDLVILFKIVKHHKIIKHVLNVI